jgi:hypothetical protein
MKLRKDSPGYCLQPKKMRIAWGGEMRLGKSRIASFIAATIAVVFTAASTLLTIGGCAKTTAPDNSEIVLLTPKGGETFHVGDTLKVTWKIQGLGLTDINAVDVELSPDNGKTWGLFLNVSSIFPNTSQWENFSWKIPDTFDFVGTKISLANDSQCLLRVEQYSPSNPNQISVTRTPFTILP